MTAPTRRGTAMITVTIPMSLAPMSLSKNGRAHWAKRARDFRDQKEWVCWQLRDEPHYHWRSAIMDINWCYARGPLPDDDNTVARVAAARDAFEMGGFVENDQHIRIGKVTFTKVKSGDECVVVMLRKEGTP